MQLLQGSWKVPVTGTICAGASNALQAQCGAVAYHAGSRYVLKTFSRSFKKSSGEGYGDAHGRQQGHSSASIALGTSKNMPHSVCGAQCRAPGSKPSAWSSFCIAQSFFAVPKELRTARDGHTISCLA